MTSESKRVALSEVCEIVSSKRIFAADYLDEGIPFYRGKEISQLARGDKASTELFISEAVYQEALRRTGPVKSGDILLTAVGTLGNPYQVRETDLPFYFKDGNVLWMRNFSAELNPTFLLYWLTSSHGREQVFGTAIGSTQAALTISALGKLEVPLPSLEQQSGVVQMLALIDRKIELNRESSKTLEAICQSLFKSWFIDFDPVKAKMVGEAPVGMDAETAALFPSSLEQSEHGYIPSGWQVVGVETLLTRLRVKGLAKSTPLKNTGRTLVLEQGDSVVAGFLDQDADVHASQASPKFIFGDHTCRMRLSTQPFSVLPNTIVLDSADVNPYWAFQATRGLQSFETYRRHWMEFAQKTVIVPPKQLTEAFGAIVAPLYAQIDSLMLESRKLAAVRDAILPGLVSGEIEIPDEMLAA